jgi:hypothetical protein
MKINAVTNNCTTKGAFLGWPHESGGDRFGCEPVHVIRE